MTKIQVFGLANCDTVRKARKWLDAQGMAFEFTAFKDLDDLDVRLPNWAEKAGMTALLNTRARNFKALDASEQAAILASNDQALAAMARIPQLIKRPVLVAGDQVLTGFDEAAWHKALGL